MSLTIHSLHADSATWNLDPASSDWNTAANWTPATVPNGPLDDATFGVSNTTTVSLSANIKVRGILFSAGASGFTISPGGISLLVITGGVINDSGITQEFVTPGDGESEIDFIKGASAGKATTFTIEGAVSGFFGGVINFFDTSTAGSGRFTLEGGAGGTSGGEIGFSNSSTADNATIISNGSMAGASQGGVSFFDTSSAGNATIIVNGAAESDGLGGSVFFSSSSTAANATLIANGTQSGLFAPGRIEFADDGTGGSARVKVFGTGNLNISLSASGVTIGSLEGDGIVYLGSFDLVVGSNNLSTTFSGIIQDGGFTGSHGSLTKIGTGKLVLANASTYTGGTRIGRGNLLVTNTTGSATGTNIVRVDGGAFGGTGIIAGPVTVGTGSGPGAVLTAGKAGANSALTIQNSLSFNSDATCRFGLNSNTGNAGGVVAIGVTIDGSALFSAADAGNTTLPAGTVLTVINNTAAAAITGAFANLPDGSTIVAGPNTFQADYQGGDGNDLTLTVVP